MTTRKNRADSATAALDAAKAVAMPDLQPPAHVILSEDATPYFADIVRARTREEWNEHQLTIAAQMAECMVQQDEMQAGIVLEGWVVENARGTLVANPRVGINEALARRQMALGRSLQMIGRATGDPRAPTAKRKLEAGARKLRAEVEAEDNGLLA